MGHQFRMVLCDEHDHDAEKKAVKDKKAGTRKKKSGSSEVMKDLEGYRRSLERRYAKKAPAMYFTQLGYEVTPGVHPNQRIADLKFSILAARDQVEYYEGLIRMMNDPNGKEARWRSARRVAGRLVISAVYFDKIEFNEGYEAVLTIEDAKEQVIMGRRRIEALDRDIEEARAEIARQEAEASAARRNAFLEHVAGLEA